MLAQNFISHDVLGISAEEQGALIKVLGLLERGELKHTQYRNGTHTNSPTIGLFNMASWSTETRCGTVCCIGGTAEAILGKAAFIDVPHDLDDLFFPGTSLRDITPTQAASALRNYLTTGEPDWKSVLATA